MVTWSHGHMAMKHPVCTRSRWFLYTNTEIVKYRMYNIKYQIKIPYKNTVCLYVKYRNCNSDTYPFDFHNEQQTVRKYADGPCGPLPSCVSCWGRDTGSPTHSMELQWATGVCVCAVMSAGSWRAGGRWTAATAGTHQLSSHRPPMENSQPLFAEMTHQKPNV